MGYEYKSREKSSIHIVVTNRDFYKHNRDFIQITTDITQVNEYSSEIECRQCILTQIAFMGT